MNTALLDDSSADLMVDSLSTIFWIAGASGIMVLGHAALLEPGVEADCELISLTIRYQMLGSIDVPTL